MNIYNKDQFNKEFRQESALSKAFISTKTYSESDLYKKMDEITKFFGIHSADVTKMEGKTKDEYYIKVTIPRSHFRKIDLPEPVFVDRIISTMERLPNALQEKAFLDLSEEDFQKTEIEFQGMIAGLGADEKNKVINDAIIVRFETKMTRLQKTRESLIQSFIKIKEVLDIEYPDIQRFIFDEGQGVFRNEIISKVVNARNALDENISILRTPLLSLEMQMQKVLGTNNDLATKNKLEEIPSKELFDLLTNYLGEQRKAIIEPPFKNLVQELARVEGEPSPKNRMIFVNLMNLIGKNFLKADLDIFINFLNTPLRDNEVDDFNIKKNIVSNIRFLISNEISLGKPQNARLNAWNKIIELYRRRDTIRSDVLSRFINVSLVDLESVKEISDMEKEIELVRLMTFYPEDPNKTKDRRLEKLVRRLLFLNPPSIKLAEELMLEVRTPAIQADLRRDIVESLQDFYGADLLILQRLLSEKLHVSKEPEYGKASTGIDKLKSALQDTCTRALQSSLNGNRNSLYELRVLLERGKSNTLKEVVNIIKELFSTFKAKLKPNDFLAESANFFKEIMMQSPFLTRVLISNIGLGDKEIHDIFSLIIKRERDEISFVLPVIAKLLKSIPKRINPSVRQALENQAVQKIKTCNYGDITTSDIKTLIECASEISEVELKASLLFTFIQRARKTLTYYQVGKLTLIEQIPEGAINREGRNYRKMAKALFGPQPVQNQNPEAVEEAEEAEEAKE